MLTEEQIKLKVEAEEKGTVAFTEAEQNKIDELIKHAMGRAGGEARQRAAFLEEQLEALRLENQQLRGNPADREALKKEVEEKQAELAQVKTEMSQAKKQTFLTVEAAKHGFIDADQVLQLTKDKVSWDDGFNAYVVSDGETGVVFGVDDQPMKVGDYFAAFAEKNPHLVRSQLKSGTGAGPSRQFNANPQADIARLKRLFGRGSDAAFANRYAISNPAEYKALREEARRAKLI